MHCLSKMIFAATAVLVTMVAASPVAQMGPAQISKGMAQAIETIVPEEVAYPGVDPGPLPGPVATPSPTPSPRYTGPVKVVSDI